MTGFVRSLQQEGALGFPRESLRCGAFQQCLNHRAIGFELWAASKGLSGDLNVLFALDRNGDGIANGFEYAFGTNLTEGLPLLTVRMVNGQPRIETPKRDIAAFDAYVVVQGCTNLLSGDWSLPIGPLIQTEKPEDRDWYAPLVGVPDNAFFRLRAILD